jgi:glutamyl-tRNA reductase
MGAIAAHALADAPVETLYVANRSLDSATELTDSVAHDEALAVALDGLPSALDAADAVVTATGSEGHVLDADDLRDSGETVVVDIAQPRDVSPAADAVDGVTVHGMAALESVTDATERRRRAAAESVEAMIDREFEHLLESYKRKRADEVISVMYESAERVKGREVSQALSKLDAHGDLSEDQREIVASMADSLVSQLLAPPTKSLRDAAADDDWATINTALQLFDPDFGDERDESTGGPPEFVREMDGEIPDEMAEQMPEEVRSMIADDD